SPAGTGEMSVPCAPDFKCTGLLTVAPSAGSTKNTRFAELDDIDAGGALAGADPAGFAGSELHAAIRITLVTAANPAAQVRMFMRRSLSTVRSLRETAPILVRRRGAVQPSTRNREKQSILGPYRTRTDPDRVVTSNFPPPPPSLP